MAAASRAAAATRSSEDRLQRLVRTTLKAGCLKFSVPQLDEATEEYLCGLASAVAAESNDISEIEAQLVEQIGPLLQGHHLGMPQVRWLCNALAVGVLPAKAAPTELADDFGSDASVLCRCNDLILMYMGSSRRLLDSTRFELVRGHRYGIVGSNGSGKTTLMERIADGAVSELPAHIRVVHVRHEDILDRMDPQLSAESVIRTSLPAGSGEENLESALATVGFDEVLRRKALRELSGGWRVRLLLAAAVAQQADVLLLDEPTNHLDVGAISWLVSYMVKDLQNSTCVIVSHDSAFLDRVCTDIVHFDDCQLKYYPGNFSAFCEQAELRSSAEAKALLQVRKAAAPTRALRQQQADGHATQNADSGGGFRMAFPVPGKVEGLANQRKPVLEMVGVSFKFPEAPDFALRNVTCKVGLTSRIAVIGPNGAGKSTLLSLLCGELLPSEGVSEPHPGEVLRHPRARLAYIAQNHNFHLADYSACCPADYISLRFKHGYDEEVQRRLTQPRSADDDAKLVKLAAKFGKYGKRIESVLQRSKRGQDWHYEVKWEGLSEKQNTFEPLSRLRQLGVLGMVTALEERLVAQASGEDRPLTQREIERHLANFGIPEDLCKQRINTFSGGQKSKLLLAAALWGRPHIVCLDEPTNFLDLETTAALAKALQSFKGGVVVASHSEDFLSKLCTEVWRVDSGTVFVQQGFRSSSGDNGQA